MKRLVCYGDSNTYGYDARDVFGGRLPANQRWTDILAEALQCDVINCGMNGRTVPRFPRSIENDLRLLRKCCPCDLLIVMLGSNDILTDRDPDDTANDMAQFLSILRQDIPDNKLVLCAPPMISGLGEAYEDRILELSDCYKSIALDRKLHFFNTASWRIELASDGVHFSPEGHRMFAAQMRRALLPLLEK